MADLIGRPRGTALKAVFVKSAFMLGFLGSFFGGFFGDFRAAWAQRDVCLELFREAGVREASNDFRSRLLDQTAQIIADLKSEEKAAVVVAVKHLVSQSQVSNQSIRDVVQGSKTLSKFAFKSAAELELIDANKPPHANPRTVQAVQTEGLAGGREGHLSAVELEAILQADPYFQWLKHNSLPYFVTINHRAGFARELLHRDSKQADPAKLFIEDRKSVV